MWKQIKPEQLIDEILELHSPNYIIINLVDRLPSGSRARVLLESFDFSRAPDAGLGVAEEEVVREVLRYLWLSSSPLNMLTKACNVKFLKERLPEELRKGDLREVAVAFLQEKNVPLLERAQGEFQNPWAAIRKIHEIRENVNRALERRDVDYLRMQGGTISAWSYVQKVLELTVLFLGLHFYPYIREPLGKQMKEALKRPSCGSFLNLCINFESLFKEEPGKLRRKKPDKKSKEEWRIRARELRRICLRDFNKPSPFIGLKPEDYKNWHRVYRNDPAHHPGEQEFL